MLNNVKLLFMGCTMYHVKIKIVIQIRHQQLGTEQVTVNTNNNRNDNKLKPV